MPDQGGGGDDGDEVLVAGGHPRDSHGLEAALAEIGFEFRYNIRAGRPEIRPIDDELSDWATSSWTDWAQDVAGWGDLSDFIADSLQERMAAVCIDAYGKPLLWGSRTFARAVSALCARTGFDPFEQWLAGLPLAGEYGPAGPALHRLTGGAGHPGQPDGGPAPAGVGGLPRLEPRGQARLDAGAGVELAGARQINLGCGPDARGAGVPVVQRQPVPERYEPEDRGGHWQCRVGRVCRSSGQLRQSGQAVHIPGHRYLPGALRPGLRVQAPALGGRRHGQRCRGRFSP